LGENDAVIPANVAEAANFYQAEGLLHGQTAIRAAEGASTRILGNFRVAYGEKPLKCENYPWYDRVFMKYHTEIECDPAVWKQVESLIRSKLPVAGTQRAESGSTSGRSSAE
jgi:phage gp45-like